LDLRTVNQAHIYDIIKSLKSKGSLDIDIISTNLLKAVHIEIGHPLAHIFKRSLDTGVFPNKLKRSRKEPTFKAGDPSFTKQKKVRKTLIPTAL
jgi:sugar-specific transcriptional regulator TrmB